MILFFFNDTATTEIYTLSLHDALPISTVVTGCSDGASGEAANGKLEIATTVAPITSIVSSIGGDRGRIRDRKSTRLKSSHANISYGAFCLKKKKKTTHELLACDTTIRS